MLTILCFLLYYDINKIRKKQEKGKIWKKSYSEEKILIKSIVFLIVITFAFMSVGYAEITDVELEIKGKLEVNKKYICN